MGYRLPLITLAFLSPVLSSHGQTAQGRVSDFIAAEEVSGLHDLEFGNPPAPNRRKFRVSYTDKLEASISKASSLSVLAAL